MGRGLLSSVALCVKVPAVTQGPGAASAHQGAVSQGLSCILARQPLLFTQTSQAQCPKLSPPL